MPRQTTVSIEGPRFRINGEVTYPYRRYQGHNLEGLLLNARLVQGVFDDRNPQTRSMWDYPDGPWDPDRNTDEFVAMMPTWREHGLLCIDINFQGGSPQGYSKHQPWHNSAFEHDGALRDDYAGRMGRIIDRADELGMVVMLGYFYFGQDHRLADESAVVRATEQATDWVLAQGYTNVLIEIANEIDNRKYTHPIIKPDRGHELMELVSARSLGHVSTPAGRLLVSNSFCGGQIPTENIIDASDFVLLHGNGVHEPDKLRKLIRDTRARDAYRGQPIVINEDDHFDFDQPDNNFLAAVGEYGSWGYFDYRMEGEGIDEGYQSVPVNWGISSHRKRGFFGLLRQMTQDA